MFWEHLCEIDRCLSQCHLCLLFSSCSAPPRAPTFHQKFDFVAQVTAKELNLNMSPQKPDGDVTNPYEIHIFNSL